MPIGAYREERLPVDQQAAVLSESNRPDADTGVLIVADVAVLADGRMQPIELRIVRMPEPGIAHFHGLRRRMRGSSGHRNAGGIRRGDVPVGIDQLLHNRADAALVRFIGDVGLHLHRRFLGGHRRKSHEDSAARYRVGEDRVGDMQRIEHLKIDAAVQASEIAEIQLVLGLAGRNLRVIGVIETNQ